jgi:predicted nucleotidyltransferase
MDGEQVIATLREHRGELERAGVTRLALFGSMARGDQTPQSDVDLMAEFDSTREYSLLDRVRLENRLADLLGVKVDLTPARMLKDGIRESATREAVFAF